MTRDDELRAALERVEEAIGHLSEAVEEMGLLNLTLRRLFAAEMVTKPDFDYRTGQRPDEI